MAIPILAPLSVGALSSITKDEKTRRTLVIGAIILGGMIIFPYFLTQLRKVREKEELQELKKEALAPAQSPPQIPSDAILLNKIYSDGGLITMQKNLLQKGIQIIKIPTVRKSTWWFDPIAVIWLSSDGKIAYIEYPIKYVRG